MRHLPGPAPARSHSRVRPLSVLGTLAVLAASALAPTAAAGQTPAERAEAARTALDAGEVARATQLLSELTGEFPDDAGLHWLLAHALLAAGDSQAATESYRTAVALSPGDPWLRLELGRTLLESGARSEAIAVLQPLEPSGADRFAVAEAETLRGLAHYWDGDLVGAETNLSRALQLDGDRAEAAAALVEVQMALAPALSSTSAYADDDQPLGALAQEAAFSFPLSGRLRAESRVGLVRRTSERRTDTALEGRAGLDATLPGGRVRLGLAAGIARRGSGLGTRFIGGGGIEIRLAPDTKLHGSWERSQYQWTVASLDTALAVSTFDLRLDRSAAPGWAGEAILRRDGFPDGNAVTSLSGWVLAPALVRPEGGLRVGYAAAFQESDRSTFAPTPIGQVGTPHDGSGVYAPYYTPDDLRTHSLILEARGGPEDGTSVRTTLVYAAWARELGPSVTLDPVDGSPSVTYAERSFTPWNLRVVLSSILSPRTTVSLTGQYRRTAFYRSGRFELAVVHRLVSPDGS